MSFTGAAVTYTVTGPGIVTFKAWGAAGGQSHWLSGTTTTRNSGNAGGGGGYTWFALRVATNDVIKLEIGGGGKGSVGSVTLASNTPGVGGFPDGGGGAASSVTGNNAFYAGGGGSTRVYLNNVLVAVAGAGGGGGGSHVVIPVSASYTGVSTIGGAGGGTTARSTPTVGGSVGATGGSQTAGGVNSTVPTDTGFQGGSLRGGNGYSSTNTTPNTLNATANKAGPGGGGGYFGGGGNSDAGSGTANVATGGAGGSGFLDTSNPAVIAGAVYQGYGVVPAGHLDPDYQGGTIGLAPNGTTSGAGVNDGGNGSVVMRFPSQSTLVTSTKTVVTYSGGAADYICPTAGTLTFKGWGGAGGGANRSNALGTAAGSAAGGGFVTFKFDVVAGDLITMMVGRGGHLGANGAPTTSNGTTTSLGHGGWPDGGRGSFDISGVGSVGAISYGGGGGSTRIYKNGVLIGVAAGGGAAGGGTSPTTLKAGAGGGTTGVSASLTGTELGSTGGSQSAGGTDPNNSADVGFYGDFLKGGHGESTTLFDPTRGGSANVLHKAGPGGGGGYYGGGGSAGDVASTTSTGGGGGSSFWLTSLTNLTAASTTAGNGTVPGGNGDTDYSLAGSPGIGCPNTASADGGNGAAVLLFVGGYPMPGPISVSNLITAGILVGVPTGSVGTITMTAPASSETTGPPPTGNIGTVTVTTPTGTAGAIDPFPTIVVTNLLDGQPVTEADITAVVSENDIDMSIADPAATVTGSIDLLVPFPANPIGGPVTMTAPNGSATGAQNITGLTIGQIDMTAPTGIGENGISVDGPLPTGAVVMTAPTGTPSTGFPALLAPLVITMSRPLATGAGLIGTLAFPNSITLTPPAASVEIGPTATGADLPITVAMTAPSASVAASVNFTTANTPLSILMHVVTGVPQSGSPVFSVSPFPNDIVVSAIDAVAQEGVAAPADLTSLITLTQPTGSARGDKNAIAGLGAPITISPVFALAEAGILVDNNVPLVVSMTAPTGTAFHAVSLAVTILPAKIILRAPQAAAFSGTFVLAIADLDPLVITMTAPNAFTSAISQSFDAIDMDYVDGYVDVPVDPSFARIKLKRSIAVGAKPSALAPREIALNEADGILYSRDGTGALKPTPYLGFGKGRLRPPGGADGEVLGVDFLWKAPPTAGGAPAQIKPPAATRVLLANNFLGVGADRPLQTVADGKYPVHYRPFFLPKSTHLTALSVYQEQGNFSTDPSVGVGGRVPLRVWLGVCGWNPNLEQPGATLAQGHLDAANGLGNLLREIAIDVVLPAGWYAAMLGAHNTTYLANQGSTLASFRAWRGGLAIGPSFVPQGEAYGLQDIGNDLTTAPAVVGHVTVADGDIPDHAYVQATTA